MLSRHTLVRCSPAPHGDTAYSLALFFSPQVMQGRTGLVLHVLQLLLSAK